MTNERPQDSDLILPNSLVRNVSDSAIEIVSTIIDNIKEDVLNLFFIQSQQ